MKTIALGSDHAGFKIKNVLKIYLEEKGYRVIDAGAHAYDEQDDYPDFIIPVAQAVSDGEVEQGVILGGSGQGEAICANRFSGVRAAVYYGGSLDILRLAREHNSANILSLGARSISEEEAKEATEIFLDTPFSGLDRHIRRIKKIDDRNV